MTIHHHQEHVDDAGTPFFLEVGVAVDEDLISWVHLTLTKNPLPFMSGMVVAMLRYRPDETRDLADNLLEAAEAAETRSSVILAMREQKIPEETIVKVLGRLEDRRGR